MDTDILAGIESELDSVLVLSGVTTKETMNDFAYRPYVHFALSLDAKIGDTPHVCMSVCICMRLRLYFFGC